MTSAIRWLAPVALAVGLGFGASSLPVQAQDSLTRVLVNVADVAMRGGYPYDRYGGDRLSVQRDAYGRPVYYRTNGNAGHHDVDHNANGYYGNAPYGNANGYYGNAPYGNANGYYGNAPYGNANGYYGNAPYGNANGYYSNASGNHNRNNSRRSNQHRKHDRHDCQRHGQCGN